MGAKGIEWISASPVNDGDTQLMRLSKSDALYNILAKLFYYGLKSGWLVEYPNNLLPVIEY